MAAVLAGLRATRAPLAFHSTLVMRFLFECDSSDIFIFAPNRNDIDMASNDLRCEKSQVRPQQ